MDAALEPMDAPTGPLFRLQVGRALEPGVYGVHWGAMSGYTTLDTRVFLFRVPEPEPSAEPAPDAEKTTATPGAKAGEPKEAAAQPPAAASEKKKVAPPEPIEPIEETDPPPSKP